MTKQQDSKSDLRVAYTRRELRNTKLNFPAGNIGIFMQVTLAITFMYLILVGYSLMGTFGVVFVSILFILALLSPILYRIARKLLINREKRAAGENYSLEPEVERKG